jgi:phosphoribosylanthranilate isomerase
MKHIGWCLEKIQIAFGNMPKELTSEDSKKQAKKVIDDVQKYADTLVGLVHHHKFRQIIHQLEKVPIDGIKMHANHIKELAKDLEHALYVIDLTLKELRELSNLKSMNENDVRRWKRSYDKLVLMIDQKFGGDWGELRKEFQIALHTKEQLQEIVKYEEHLAEFLK